MGKKKDEAGEETEAGNEIRNERIDPSIPEGFTPVSASGGLQNWFKPESMSVIWGEMLGRYKRKKTLGDSQKEGHFYQIMIEKPCTASRKIDEETVEIELEPGDVINVDERSALEELSTLPESGKRWRVYIKPLEKVPVKGTMRTVWRFSIGKMEIIPGKNEPRVQPKMADAFP